jgi:hypothetical protein
MKTRFERCPPGLHDYAAFADAKTGQDGSFVARSAGVRQLRDESQSPEDGVSDRDP